MAGQETIYFLDWLKSYGIEPDDFLNDYRRENEHLINIPSFAEYVHDKHYWLIKAFSWDNSTCLPFKSITKYDKKLFFSDLEDKWSIVLKNNKNVLFSRYLIEDYKVQTTIDTFKLNFD